MKPRDRRADKPQILRYAAPTARDRGWGDWVFTLDWLSCLLAVFAGLWTLLNVAFYFAQPDRGSQTPSDPATDLAIGIVLVSFFLAPPWVLVLFVWLFRRRRRQRPDDDRRDGLISRDDAEARRRPVALRFWDGLK